MKRSSKTKPTAEERALLKLREFNFPQPERGYRFHKDRKWEFDFAWPDLILKESTCKGGHDIIDGEVVLHSNKLHRHFDCRFPDAIMVALEIEGRGRHQTAAGYAADCEKYNAAQVLGWIVIRIPASQVNNHEWYVQLFDAMKRRGGIE